MFSIENIFQLSAFLIVRQKEIGVSKLIKNLKNAVKQ
jgi:hypothetical protein